jgi:hypothetical protein
VSLFHGNSQREGSKNNCQNPRLTPEVLNMIVLLHGTQSSRKRIGFTADFCPVCLGIRPFQFLAVGRADHVFFVSLGHQHTDRHLRKCQTCGVELPAAPERYQSTVRALPAELDELIKQTYPLVHEQNAPAMTEAEWLLKSTPEAAPGLFEDRAIQLLSAFNPMVERRYARRSDFDPYSSLGCLGTILVVAVLGIFFNADFLFGLKVLAAGFIVTVFLVAGGARRFVRKEVVPGLAIGFRALKAQPPTIQKAFDRAASLGLKIGRKIKAADIISK